MFHYVVLDIDMILVNDFFELHLHGECLPELLGLSGLRLCLKRVGEEE